jgi:Uma2 family endonuclease
MPVSSETYTRVALEDPEGRWELVCGRLRPKPLMTTEHNAVLRLLLFQLIRQLDEREFVVSADMSRVRVTSGSYYVPDLFVLPRAYERRLRQQPGTFEVYVEPMPLVVEVWPPSTGDYDLESKLQEYQRRGDAEIWLIHPYERTLTAWRRTADGYSETTFTSGTIAPSALPGVTIDLAALFD